MEVRDDEAEWPTHSLLFASTVLRILLDSIAGNNYRTHVADAQGNVFCRRLRIAGRANRQHPVLWGPDERATSAPAKNGRDVTGAPAPLYLVDKRVSPILDPEAEHAQVRYLDRFQSDNSPGSQLLTFPTKDVPNRYDFYRMVLEFIDAILTDEGASLWKNCQREFKGNVGEAEMRRLTLLILMMLPALIHEQLEHDDVRVKKSSHTPLSAAVMHLLLQKAQSILTNAARKTRQPWNPVR